MAQTFSLFETGLGWCGIAGAEGRIRGALLPEETPDRVRAHFRRRHPEAAEAPPEPWLEPAIARVRALIEGADDDLRDLDLDMSEVPAFERRVYEIARGIVPGQTATYGEIARQIGAVTDSQAVGRALGRNPFAPIVPCHRVVAAGQKLGGFSATGGRSLKLRMLENERRWAQDDLFGQAR
ncbi:MAG TPA: methylated-DNA--[protein]-cysteine S-methyltransferase [Caulobacteraceae bacterium]|jgi:methylated-DNA-[protein]-cysteine S-methyltransferase|nr:methylated-DNA--[protein]-cysteine S-methyltransferase [Caulobacteraceae bacterium]